MERFFQIFSSRLFQTRSIMEKHSQPDTPQTKTQSTTSSTQGAASGSAQNAGSNHGDQERSITPQREGGTSVSRRPQSSTVSRSTDPFTLMRRMSEDMDRLFQQFGF